MSQTRRLAAIFAADVAGYSRLMGADEEGTHERLKALHRDRAAHRIDDAGKLDQQAVAGGLDDAAPVFRDLGMEKRGAVLLEVAQRRLFVDAHQAAVADDVTGENRGKSAFGPLVRHGRISTDSTRA